ncbi:MAG: endonuclease III [Planctomycetes bacterium]|nr:endonuclease III [Planctomycetota bacterium]
MSNTKKFRTRVKSPLKQPFDIKEALPRLRKATAAYPKAALFELHTEGHSSVFEILIACIISIRTYDEVTLPVARKLFAKAPNPAELAALTEKEIDSLIRFSTYHEAKAKTIRTIAKQTVEEYGGVLPGVRDVLLSFKGVGPKCANLALGISCNQPLIGVDIHVHRVTNRWGLVCTKTPEKTMEALQDKLPEANWVEINALLVPFGKHVCTGSRPACSTCPLLQMCQQVGVTSHR